MGETQSLPQGALGQGGRADKKHNQKPHAVLHMETELVSMTKTEQGTKVSCLTPAQRPSQLLPHLPTHLATA